MTEQRETLEEAKIRLVKERKETEERRIAQLKRYPVKNEEYMSFVEEIAATFTEGMFIARNTVIETYHEIGKIIVQSQRDIPMERLSEDLNIKRLSAQTLDRAKRMYQTWPDLQLAPFDKSTSWHDVVNKMLPGLSTKKKPWSRKENREEKTDWVICPFCKSRFNSLKASRPKENEI